jgi:cell division protein FtsI/penicillin-binding protein 2
VLKKLVSRDTGFVYLARRLPASKAREIKKLDIAGLAFTPANRRMYPREWPGLAGARHRRDRRQGPVGPGVLAGQGAARQRRAGARSCATRSASRSPSRPRARRGRRPHDARARRGDPGQGRGGPAEGRREVPPQGRHRGRHGPAHRRGPRQRQLAARRRQRRRLAPDYAKQNRAVGFNYEPGSTFKAITVAGALEAGEVTPDTSFDLPPQIQVADRTIGESHPRGYVNLTTSEILAQSSNVGAIKIGMKLGDKRFDAWTRRFGFGRKTDVDLPARRPAGARAQGLLGLLDGQPADRPGRQRHADADGHRVRRDRQRRRPAPAAHRAQGQRRPDPTPKGHRVISPQTAKALREMLKGVLAAGGTGAEASIPGYELAGKTGTANKVDESTGTYSESRYIASFTGFAPADKPRLLVAVMVDEPQGGIYGGDVAAPAFQQITSFALNYLRIPPE